MTRRRRGRIGWAILVLAAVFVLIAGISLLVTGECPKWCVAALGVAMIGELVTEAAISWTGRDTGARESGKSKDPFSHHTEQASRSGPAGPSSEPVYYDSVVRWFRRKPSR